MMKRFLVLPVLLIGAMIFLSMDKVTTGPSHATSLIVPVGVSPNGKVLCKTHYTVNEMGAHMLMENEYGWLVVDANGTWEEAPHIHIPADLGEVEYDVYDSMKKVEEWFDDYLFDLEDYPASLEPLIEKHGIEYGLYGSLGRSTYFWTENGIQDGRDSMWHGPVKQRSINNMYNDSVPGTRIGCAAAIKGVLFFDNYSGYSDMDDELGAGASFFHDQYEWGIDIYTVTGICFLPPKK